MKAFTALALCFFASLTASAQNPELLAKAWTARWITVPGTAPFDYGVYHFRQTFDLTTRPSRFVIHVTGDNRYQLYVNGERAVWGPARGDLKHWRYETVDIARFLKPGKNVLAAVVWNYAQFAPEAQVTNQTGFLLQGDTKTEQIVDTNKSWKAVRNESYELLPVTHHEMRGYFVAGPGERVDAKSYPWNWETIDFDDSQWQLSQTMTPGSPRDARDGPNRWMLVPRNIPLMEEKPERLLRVRQSNGVVVPASFPQRPASFRIPSQTKARLLLDQTYLTTAYPELIVSGGKGAITSLRYAESLYLPGARQGEKGNRDEVEGKEFIGYRDVFIGDGGHKRLFRPLWWRTYRYLELSIETKDEPLTVEDLRGVYTGYPFERKARFDARSTELKNILDVGWRTARLCAHETYMDCPYYEQLQYVGDTRIQALVSLYMTGDDRLMRNAIELIDSSRTAEGLTESRAPTRLQQYIPPFSLWWVGMVHDFWMYRDDPAFVREKLPGVRAVLSFFAARQKANGSLNQLPWWNYVDWVKEWANGEPPVEADGSSASLDLQLLLAYGWAAEMESALGSKGVAEEYRRAEAQLRASIRSLYWDSSRQLFADTPVKTRFSQHTNALAALADVVEGEEARGVMERAVTDRSLTQSSIYFRHYVHSALNKVGTADRYLSMLGPWREMLKRGLTTWAETSDPSRSDCHAWGASPNYELFRTVLGVDSEAPGFKRVIIRPFLGELTEVSGAIPHPKGEIAVRLLRRAGKLEAEVNLPEGIEGKVIWNGAERFIGSGKSKLVF